MHKFIKSTLLVCLLLSCVSFAQDDNSIVDTYRTTAFEDFPGETECMEAHAVFCGHNRFVCHTTTLDELFENSRDVPNLNADVFVCTMSGVHSRGSMADTVVSLRLHQNEQVADLHMLRMGSFGSSSRTTPNMRDQSYTDATLLSFEPLDASSYAYIKRNTRWGTRRVAGDNPGTMMAWRESEKYLLVFSIVENQVLSTKEIPLADYEALEGSFEEFLEGKYVDEGAIESYEEALARLATLPDQLTYTLDWPNTLTISVNPDADPTEAQLEWVGVHDLSPLTSDIKQEDR
ncbi:MAG: hypothetical protein AAF708_13120 [Deinococcota bacterium]